MRAGSRRGCAPRSRLRERLYAEPYYRAVYGEADGLPGLVIDRYGARCVVQIGTAGMELMKPHIRDAAERVFECETLIFKNDGAARELEGLPAYVEAAKGRLERQAEVVEGGLRFRVPLAEGQKTGWFFDQAANRRALDASMCAPGARVLDVFSYVGAWGARAAQRTARPRWSASTAPRGARARGCKTRARTRSKIATRKGDAFDVLEALGEERARFDIVIIDPPAFAKRKKDLPKALAAYKRLNQLALQAARGRWDPGVVLVLVSCRARRTCRMRSPRRRAAPDKHLQVLELGGQAPDHPVHPAIPETRYLKAYFCRVNESLK